MNRREQDRLTEQAKKGLESRTEKCLQTIDEIWGRDDGETRKIPQRDDALILDRMVRGLSYGGTPSSLRQVGIIREGGGINPAPLLADARRRGLIPHKTTSGYALYQIN